MKLINPKYKILYLSNKLIVNRLSNDFFISLKQKEDKD